MALYRKKSVVIDAWQYKPARNHWPQWLSAAISDGTVWLQGGDPPYLTMKTLAGEYQANPGDWIIRDKGELYPIKADIFAAIYEPADASHPPPVRSL